MLQVDYIFDFASPNAYLTHKVIPSIETRTGIKFNYIPCLLGGIFKSTGNQAPMIAFANIPAKLAYENLEFERFIQKHRLDKFTMNPHFPVNTITLMRGAVAAKAHDDDALKQYVEVVFHSMWEQPMNLGDPQEVTKMLITAGYSAEEFLEQTQSPEIKQHLIDNTAQAVERGVFGIPTIFVDEEMFYGKERLNQVEEEIIKRRQ